MSCDIGNYGGVNSSPAGIVVMTYGICSGKLFDGGDYTCINEHFCFVFIFTDLVKTDFVREWSSIRNVFFFSLLYLNVCASINVYIFPVLSENLAYKHGLCHHKYLSVY